MIGGFIFFMMRQAQGTNNQALSFGKSRARMFLGNKTVVTFNDVAGVDEAKTELQEVVEFLKYPEKFNSLGARIPRGVLLVGPPGTGKTLMARAVAGEAGVPFFSISGSEFVEMFVGVGASRVRDLFDQAKRNSPCIVFVDEIDAVGRQRGAGLGGSHDEREQTLNQILVEMDGFDTNTNVIVVAATNRPDVLDPALLRPGRFDRQVILDRPDMRAGPRSSRSTPRASRSTRASTSKASPASRRASPAPTSPTSSTRRPSWPPGATRRSSACPSSRRPWSGSWPDPERKSRVISDAEKAIIAYHEGGHAVVQRILPKCDPVAQGDDHQPRHGPRLHDGPPAGGPLPPVQDRVRGQDRRACSAATSPSGMIFGDTTTGASNDIEKATDLARRMVTEFGMSDKLGPLSFGKRDELVFLGREIGEQRNYSDEVAKTIDEEVRAIIDKAYERATEVLTTHKDKLVALAEKLVAEETVDSEGFEALFTRPAAQGDAHGAPTIDRARTAGPGAEPAAGLRHAGEPARTARRAGRRRPARFDVPGGIGGAAAGATVPGPERDVVDDLRLRVRCVGGILADRRQHVAPDRAAAIPTTGTARNIPRTPASVPPAGIAMSTMAGCRLTARP